MRLPKEFFTQILISLLFLELSSYALLKAGIIPDIYSEMGINEPLHLLNQGLRWRSEKEEWGAWHKPNKTDSHQRKCFNISYQSNNLGARDDKDYPYQSKTGDTIVALGDSFMEGYGLTNKATLPKQIEQLTNSPVYNLGSSNDVGPLQYLMIYKNFKHLPHNIVVTSFLPSNDFTDNDLSKSKAYGKTRYRPYYNVEEAQLGYPPRYTDQALKKLDIDDNSMIRTIESQLFRSSLARVLKNARLIYYRRGAKIGPPPYMSGSIKQQKAAIAQLKKLYFEVQRSGAKKFIVLSIPSKADFTYYLRDKAIRTMQPWEADLMDFSKKHVNFLYIDGFRVVEDFGVTDKNFPNLFHRCDGHWNEHGAYIYARLIADVINTNNK